MKIYIAHSTGFDFRKELYEPIQNSLLAAEHEFVFPHEKSEEPFDSKELFEEGCDLVIAEVSYRSTGVGIELGWADILDIPVACIHKRGSKISKSLTKISEVFLEYGSAPELQRAVERAIEE